MTGLDVKKEHIIEMACLVTDQDLNIIAEVLSIFCSPWLLNYQVSAW